MSSEIVQSQREAVSPVFRPDLWIFPEVGREGTEISSLQFGDVSDHSQLTMPRDFSMKKPHCNGRQVTHKQFNSVYSRKKWTLPKVWKSSGGEFSASMVPLPARRTVRRCLSPAPHC